MSRIFLESGARRIARLHVIHAGYLYHEAIDGGHLEANQIHHGIGCAPGIAEEIIAIHRG